MTSVENHWFCAQMKLEGTSLIWRHDSHHVTMVYKEKHTPSYFVRRSSYEQNYRPTHISDKIPAILPFWERLLKTQSPSQQKKQVLQKTMDFHGKIEKFQGNNQRYAVSPPSNASAEKPARRKSIKLNPPEKTSKSSHQNGWFDSCKIVVFLYFHTRAVKKAVKSEEEFVACWTKNEHLIFWLLG